MPFSEVYISTFKNDIESNQLLIQTAMALQTNKFIQVRRMRRLWPTQQTRCLGWDRLSVTVDLFLSSQPLLARKSELDKLRKDLKEQWQREQKKMVCNAH